MIELDGGASGASIIGLGLRRALLRSTF